MKIIVGLGNPGSKYKSTRHNIGYMVIDEIARSIKIPIRDRHEDYLSGLSKIEGEEVVLVKPITFMNRSGKAVKRFLSDHKGVASDLVVIHDDMDMALGRLRIKTRGGHGGHRGVSSIIDSIGTDRFVRIKVGIGRKAGIDPADFVLEEFDRSDLQIVDGTVKMAAEAALYIVSSNIRDAMNRYNR